MQNPDRKQPYYLWDDFNSIELEICPTNNMSRKYGGNYEAKE